MTAIRLKIEREVVLDDLWYDERWHAELLADGWTNEGALREMVRLGLEEDWTSLLDEVFTGGSTVSLPDAFCDSITSIETVDGDA